jgi:hypothetical protein
MEYRTPEREGEVRAQPEQFPYLGDSFLWVPISNCLCLGFYENEMRQRSKLP